MAEGNEENGERKKVVLKGEENEGEEEVSQEEGANKSEGKRNKQRLFVNVNKTNN